MRRAVFLDRDGVLNRWVPEGYVRNPGELHLLPGVESAVARLREAGFVALLISNQQGVGKGLMSQADLDAVTKKLTDAVALDGIYYCTALQSENSPRRKPAPGMVLEAAAEHQIALEASVFIGDTKSDCQAARAAGVGAFVLVLTGQTPRSDADALGADYVAEGLSEAADWVLARR